MFERYTLSCTYFPSQSFDETGCDLSRIPYAWEERTHYRRHLLFIGRPKGNPTPKRLIYSTSRSGTTFKLVSNLPTPLSNRRKSTCTGFYVYIEIIYIDSSPDPDIFAPYVYNDPSDEFIRHLYDGIGDTNYISDH